MPDDTDTSPISRLLHRAAASLTALAVAGCTSSAISPDTTDLTVPGEWLRDADRGAVQQNWLETFDSAELNTLVDEAVRNNYRLEQERALLRQAEHAVTVSRADRLPELGFGLSATRRGFEDNSGARITSNSFTAGVDASWEADLWGRLSKQQQAAHLQYMAQQARVQLAERELAAATASALFRVMEAQQLLEVADRRLKNLSEFADIVDSGYRQGLNDALDLYLARNTVEREQAALAQQRQTVFEAIADLQLALARYPDGQMIVAGELPVITDDIPAGLPSELLTRRTDIQEAWLNLLAADAQLAAAHKARFPSLVLVGSGGATTVDFANLLEGDGASWSLLVNLSQPLFQGGRLAALEAQARERVRIAEQQYLELVFSAFADVENAISQSAALSERYQSFLDAERNAGAALDLALEQYQRGLVNYTTVLESQRQFFDAEATVVQLRNELLQNRISLYLALGGEFSTDY